MNKPTIPENNLPEHFAIEGVKTEFTDDKIQNGYQAGIADIFGGGQLNYWLDTTGENISYLRKICDFITNLPVAKTITVDTSGKLVYRDWLGGRNFGELVYSAIPLSDSGLKLLDGSILSYTGIYKNFIDYIASIVNTYPSIFTTEQNWQASVSSNGVCGKFVYNSTNKTVRLPKITCIIEGTIDLSALGSFVAAGLPTLTTNTVSNHTHTGTTANESAHTHTRGTMDITGHFDGIEGGGHTTGAFYRGGSATSSASSAGTGDYYVEFQASRNWSGKTSGGSAHNHSFTTGGAGSHNHTVSWGANTNTVQPKTVKMFVYIVVATSILKTDEVIDVDEIMSTVNNKADSDGSNMVGSLSSSAKSYFTRLALPSTVKTDIVIPISGNTITVPADGYICCTEDIKLTNTTRHLYGNYLAVISGDIITVTYDTTDENSEIIFVYAQGGM